MDFTHAQLKMVTDFMTLQIVITLSNGNTRRGLVACGYDTYKTIFNICEKSGLEVVKIEVY